MSVRTTTPPSPRRIDPRPSESHPGGKGGVPSADRQLPGVGADPTVEIRRALAEMKLGRTPRVLLIGNYGRGNTGDEAVLAGLAGGLAGEAIMTVASRDPERVTAMHGVPAVRMAPLAGLWAVLRSDVIAVGGGGMFGKGVPPLVAVLPGLLLAARFLLGKRLLFVSLGVYVGTPRVTLLLLKLAAAVADGVFLRDTRSVTTVSSGCVGRRVRPSLVGDAAVFMRAAQPTAARRLMRTHGIRLHPAPLLLSIKATPQADETDRLVSVLAEVAAYWTTRTAADVVILPLSEQGDYGLGASSSDVVLGERVRKMSGCGDRVTVLPAGLQPGVAKAVVRKAAAVVGVRFHSLVFGASTGRQTLGLVFEEKALAFAEEVGLPSLPVRGLRAAPITTWLDTVAGDGPEAEQSDGTVTNFPEADAIAPVWEHQVAYVRSEIEKLNVFLELLACDDFNRVILDVTTTVVRSLRRGGKVLFCGNVGSATDCRDIAAQLVGPQNFARAAAAGVFLTFDGSQPTTKGDGRPDAALARQVEASGSPGDVLFGLSTSGTSSDVMGALDVATRMGIRTVSVTGTDPADMSLADHVLATPVEDAVKVQELHVLCGHFIFEMVEQALFHEGTILRD